MIHVNYLLGKYGHIMRKQEFRRMDFGNRLLAAEGEGQR